ncbi:hypothetical protein AURDEDRAFT_161313 [Auricularia subglabra TFB-10046 SS5]|nr:hypothetical protein AURDEDRAFT_161313 [Auricularia subglabra TFB-10046 SS5]
MTWSASTAFLRVYHPYVYLVALLAFLPEGDFGDPFDRADIDWSRQMLELIEAESPIDGSVRDTLERNFAIAEAILDDPSHTLYIRGLGQRLQLRFVLWETTEIVLALEDQFVSESLAAERVSVPYTQV